MVAAVVAGCGRFHFDPLGAGASADGGPVDGADGRPVDGLDAPAPNLLYASTYPGALRLYQIDPSTLEPSAGRDLCTNIPGIELGEIIFDASGALIGFGFPDATMYRIAPDLAMCTAFQITSQGVSIGSPVKGADLIPSGGVGPDRVMLVATENAKLYQIDTTDGTARMIASLAAAPSGDLVWTGTELLMSTAQGGNDRLVRVDPTNGNVQTIGTTAFAGVYGMAARDGILYAFTGGGRAAILDPSTAATVKSITTTQRWGGAAVH